MEIEWYIEFAIYGSSQSHEHRVKDGETFEDFYNPWLVHKLYMDILINYFSK